MEIRWLNEHSKAFLEKDYLLPGQTVQERLKVIGDAAERILGMEGYGEKLQRYVSNGWISLSTPMWTNFGVDRGLPISCFGVHVDDSVESILSSVAEIGTMSKHGGGTSGYFGALRPRGSEIKNNGHSNGSKAFLELFQSCAQSMNQGSVRRGYFSAYQDISHPDFEEWLNIRAEGDPIQHITWGACVSDEWLKSMRDGDAKKRKIWARVIQKKFETGLPYIFFTDNANNHESVPEVYRGKGKILSSQMCSEIMLPADNTQSFVCDLGSMNDFYYDEWKDTDCVEVLTFLLDAAMTEFIEKASKIKFLSRAVEFSKKHRAIGIGRLGYHSMLQSRMIPFESLLARNLNIEIQRNIQENSMKASKKLAELFGECEMTKGLGRRNTTTQAIAPTTSSAFIMQVSQSIEPWMSNYMIKDLSKGKFVIKNVFLERLLQQLGKNTDEVWESIQKQQGSVLHLDFLTDDEKLVFKTAREISQTEIVVQAAHRQKYIDQGQSLNLLITADTKAKEVNELILLAHDMGLKSLYYQHNISKASEFAKNFNHCVACE